MSLAQLRNLSEILDLGDIHEVRGQLAALVGSVPEEEKEALRKVDKLRLRRLEELASTSSPPAPPKENVKRATVVLEWNEDLSEGWMNVDNLRTLLFTAQATREGLLRVVSFTRDSDDQQAMCDVLMQPCD